MSCAPRPHMYPSLISPLNGGTFQCGASLVTTSMWFSRMMRPLRLSSLYAESAPTNPRAPAHTRTPDSQSLLHPESSCRTPPPAFHFPEDSSYRPARYSCIHVTARSEYCCNCSAEIRDDAITGDSDQPINGQATANVTSTPAQTCAKHFPLNKFLLPKFDDYPSMVTRGYLLRTDRTNSLTCTRFSHAVFISGFPKLPCLAHPGYLYTPRTTTISIDINI